MLVEKTLYGFDDVTIIPSKVSSISSRSEVQEDVNRLLWASPMDTVIDENNINLFHDNRINVCSVRGMWKTLNVDEISNIVISITLQEAQNILTKTNKPLYEFIEKYQQRFGRIRLLIDVANGHMSNLLKFCESLKKTTGADLGVGNIAFPETYLKYAELGVDWIRVGIGTGSRCHTSSKTSIHYPMISLLDEISNLKAKYGATTKVIADGGIKNSSDIVKSFAAGADGVMLGSIFNKAIESAGNKHVLLKGDSGHITSFGPMKNENAVTYFKDGFDVEVEYRGMSTIGVQEKENGHGNHKNYEEGFSKRNKVKYTLKECLNEINYSVKSAFSYCNAKTLKEFQQNAKIYLVNNLNNHNRI